LCALLVRYSAGRSDDHPVCRRPHRQGAGEAKSVTCTVIARISLALTAVMAVLFVTSVNGVSLGAGHVNMWVWRSKYMGVALVAARAARRG